MEITSGGALTAGELIRSARSRAALSQHELAERLGVPRTQIGRWENGDVEPAFATVRRVLRACGFDLSTALVPYDPDAPHVARLVELSRLTPKERLDAALLRGGHRRLGYTFDPYTVLGQLDEAGVEYILVGSLARVLRGADEIPEDFDLVIPKGARLATDEAILTFGMRAPPGGEREGTPGATGTGWERSRPGRYPRGPRATETSVGGPSGSTSVVASDRGSPRRAIWFA